MKIMIVDDEVIIRTGLARVINWHDLGLELLTPAASAEEVLERISTERPDILLTDIRMTGKTGLEVVEDARAILPNLEILSYRVMMTSSICRMRFVRMLAIIY